MHVYFQMKNCGKNLGDLVSYNKCPDLCFHLLKFFFFFSVFFCRSVGKHRSFFLFDMAQFERPESCLLHSLVSVAFKKKQIIQKEVCLLLVLDNRQQE